MIAFIVILLILVIAGGIAYYVFTREKPVVKTKLTPTPKEEPPKPIPLNKEKMDFKVYEKPDCTGRVVRSMSFNSNSIPLDSDFNIKGTMEACCALGKNTKIKSAKIKISSTDSMNLNDMNEDEIKIVFKKCSSDYEFNISPLK